MDIKKIRASLGLTQQETADYLKISRRTYQYLEKVEEHEKSLKYDFFCDQLLKYNDDFLYSFNTNVVLGNKLSKFKESVSSYKKRFCYKHLINYLNNDNNKKVCILYGLRRTGKTTMIFQALSDINIKEAAYIKIKETDNMSLLIKDINKLYDAGIKYLFIDEITLINDFINTAATLPDIFCQMGMKIVLSGTDSLGFGFADKDELYDRNIMIHTSYISFKEFSYVLDINDIDKYIEYGGTFKIENMGYDDPDFKNDEVSFKDIESTRKYIDSSISRNIQRSLKNNHFGAYFANLKELYENQELTNVINRILNNMNHDFLISVINNKFESSDLGSSKQLLLHNQNKNIQNALYDINHDEVIKKMTDILDIKEKDELNVKITKNILIQVKTYLIMLDLIKDVEVRYSDGHKEMRTIFVQPGMRYSITKSLIYSLMEDEYFSNMAEKEKQFIIEKIISDVKGRMLEDIVLLEEKLSNKDQFVFKYIDITKGEIDMVSFNKDFDNINVYEIKHSDKISYESQSRYLHDDTLLEPLIKRYGNIANKIILYNGKTAKEKDILYKNVVEYLKEL